MNKIFFDHIFARVITKLGLMLAIANIGLVFYFYYKNCWGRCSSGDLFNEPFLFHIAAFINVPAILFASMLFSSLGYDIGSKESVEVIEILFYIFLFLAIAVQWLAIGYIIDRIYRKLLQY